MMYKFSQKSLKNLQSCHKDLQLIFSEVINFRDITILQGYRSISEQMQMYKKGRELNSIGRWEIFDKNKIVTNCDGIYAKSKHNYNPSLAIDVVPYPIVWDNIVAFYDLAEFVKNIAKKNNIKIKWGGEFKTIKDYPHWELEL